MNCVSEMRRRPPSVYASATGTVMQKAKVSDLTVFPPLAAFPEKVRTDFSIRLHRRLMESQQHVSSSNRISQINRDNLCIFAQSLWTFAVKHLYV